MTDVLTAARELSGKFEAREEKHDRDGEIAASNIDDLVAAGFLRLNVPREHGGSGASLRETLEVLRTLANGSPSTALMLGMHTSILANYLLDVNQVPDEERALFRSQREWAFGEAAAGKIFAVANSESGARGDVRNSLSTVTPRPTLASPVCYLNEFEESDLVLNGAKSFASFGTRADYFMCAARDSDGRVDYYLVGNEPSSVSLHSEWDGLGMRSSESVTLQFHDAPVMDVLCYRGLLDGANKRHWSTLSFAAVVIGTAESLLASTTATAGGALQQSETTSLHLIVQAARAFLRHCADEEPAVPDEQYSRLVRDCKTFAARELTLKATALYTAMGGGAYAFNSPVSRKFRDLLAGPSLRPPLGVAFDEIWNEISVASANGAARTP